MSVQAQPHPLGGSIPRLSTRRVGLIGAGLAIVIAGLFVAGSLPRLRRQAGLNPQAKQEQNAVPAGQVVTPQLVSDGGVSLPVPDPAVRGNVINARTTGSPHQRL